MRNAILFVAGVMLTPGVMAQAPKESKLDKRYGLDVDLNVYPQATAKEALASVLKAIEGSKIPYLLAHLTDPAWVDQRVRETHNGKFDAMVEETMAKLSANRASIKELRRFLEEGTWEATETAATVKVKEILNRQVYLRKVEGRWFFESRQQPEAAPKEK